MTGKERMMLALRREIPDRVPATVHQWQPYHLEKHLDGIDALAAFRRFGLDAAITCYPLIETRSPQWLRSVAESRSPEGFLVQRITYTTPEGVLSETIEYHAATCWRTEYPIKRPEDVDLFARYFPVPKIDRQALSREYDRLGDAGIMRGFVWGEQGGCWQHAAAWYGLEELIVASFDAPDWVHRFLRALQDKKMQFIGESLSGASYDLIETGGGASSSTCISPEFHREFCLPYDREQHDALHALGLPVVYHTCGGMMPLLDTIVENGCDASETLTPPGMGGDARHAEIKRRIGSKVCLVGGMNQFEVLDKGTPGQIRNEVFRLFADLGAGGGYMMSPSDHFFETPPENMQVYADAANECRY